MGRKEEKFETVTEESTAAARKERRWTRAAWLKDQDEREAYIEDDRRSEAALIAIEQAQE